MSKRLISHRGNTNGKNPDKENKPDYIYKALQLGYDVEVDVRFIDGKFKLGHDEPKYDFPFELIENYSNKLWLHCKNIEAVVAFRDFPLNTGVNYFWHQTDHITLTSKGYIWAYPGKQPIERSIAVLPEIHNDDVSLTYGICSDYIDNYKEHL